MTVNARGGDRGWEGRFPSSGAHSIWLAIDMWHAGRGPGLAPRASAGGGTGSGPPPVYLAPAIIPGKDRRVHRTRIARRDPVGPYSRRNYRLDPKVPPRQLFARKGKEHMPEPGAVRRSGRFGRMPSSVSPPGPAPTRKTLPGDVGDACMAGMSGQDRRNRSGTSSMLPLDRFGRCGVPWSDLFTSSLQVLS